MPAVIRHPFGLGTSGSVATVAGDSEASDTQLLAILSLTRVGERPAAPAFGIPDPTFVGFSSSAFIAAAARFGPPVKITDVDVQTISDTAQQVTVRFR